MDDEDVNVSSDVVRVALPDVSVSVDVDSTSIKYNPNATVYCNAFFRPIPSTYCDYRACISVCLYVHRLHVSKTKSSCSYEIFQYTLLVTLAR